MTDYLDEIQARADAATDGPWAAIERALGDVYIAELGMYGVAWDEPAEWHDSDEASLADAEFIAHARTDVPRLVAALRAVEALCAEARAGLSIPPIDCTGSCSDGPCDCSGVFRVRAWDLDPDRIRTAIRVLLDHVPADQVELREGLARGYVYLAQFVADDDAALIAEGSAALHGGPVGEAAEPAMRLINRIKLDMERALEELRGGA